MTSSTNYHKTAVHDNYFTTYRTQIDTTKQFISYTSRNKLSSQNKQFPNKYKLNEKKATRKIYK